MRHDSFIQICYEGWKHTMQICYENHAIKACHVLYMYCTHQKMVRIALNPTHSNLSFRLPPHLGAMLQLRIARRPDYLPLITPILRTLRPLLPPRINDMITPKRLYPSILISFAQHPRAKATILLSYQKSTEPETFNFRFVDEIKHLEIVNSFEKSRLVVIGKILDTKSEKMTISVLSLFG